MAALYQHKQGRQPHYIDFTEARHWVRAEGLGSRRQYFHWWRLQFHKTKRPPLPCRPDLVYSEQWRTWNDWLATHNQFGGGANFHKYLRFSEALAYARSLNLNSVRAWHETTHPPNVPRWPNTAYRNQFISWRHWLGKTALSQVQAAKTFQENRLLVVARLPNSPANQLYVYVEPDGFPGLRTRWRQYQLHLIKVFYYEDGSRWQSVMNTYGEGTDGHTWTVWNVSGALFDIDLEAVPPHELRARLVDQYASPT